MMGRAAGVEGGGRAGGWAWNWVEDATTLPDGLADDAYGCYYAYFWHIARRDYAAAGKAIVRATVAEKSLSADYRPHPPLQPPYYYLPFHAHPHNPTSHSQKCN